MAQADVVIAAHESLFHELPKKARDGVAVIIVDEAWWQAGLNEHRELHVASLAQEPLTHPVLDKRGKADNDATADLHEISAKAQRAFEATLYKEFPSKQAAIDAGLTIAGCKQAPALEWGRMVTGTIQPGQTANDRRKALHKASGNAAIPRRAAMWKALQALLEGEETHTGRLQMDTKTTPEGTTKVIVLRTRKDVLPAMAALPILGLDATAQMWIMRHFLPRMELLAEVNADAPHMRIHQVLGGWGITSLIQHPEASDTENQRRAGMVRELADFAALNSGGNAVVMTYKDIEAEFQRPGIRTGHFGALVGLDHLKDVRCAFVIGRPLPKAVQVHETVLALTGKAIANTASQIETRGATMADGSGSGIGVRCFADPDMEAVRAAITDVAIIQAIGRPRGVNRTAADPVDVFLFADVVVPLPVVRVVRWEDVRPGVIDRMRARRLVLFSPADASRKYVDLFDTPKAAEHAISRAGAFPPQLPIENFSIGDWGGNQLVEVTYKPHGRGQQHRRALVAPERLATLGDELADLLRVPVQVEPVPTPQPAIQEEPVMEQPEAPMPELTPVQSFSLHEAFRRMAAPWPSKECDYWALDASELTKPERWELMPMPSPVCQAVPAAMPGGRGG